MKGDEHKPKPTVFRWIDAFCDGLYTPKGHYRVPSQTDDKKYARRWRRRKEKIKLKEQVNE